MFELLKNFTLENKDPFKKKLAAFYLLRVLKFTGCEVEQIQPSSQADHGRKFSFSNVILLFFNIKLENRTTS